MLSRRPSARRAGRTLTAGALGLVLAGALGLAGPGAATSAAAPAPPSTTSAAAAEVCAPGEVSTARLAHGSHAVDPSGTRPGHAAALDRSVRKQTARLRALGLPRANNGTITVKTYVHILKRRNNTGGVPRKQIDWQLSALNKAYSGKSSPWAAATPFRFKLAGITTTKNDKYHSWRLHSDGREPTGIKAIKRKLHRGGPDALNVYVTGLSDGLLGYATFPGGPPGLDGVVVLNGSLPGGKAAPYNKGDTLVHEVGHWLGLYHTFQGGCWDPAGDEVGDTPFQDNGDNVYQCGTMDTCPLPGKDPVRNFMSYGTDACLFKFTRGQAERMLGAWYAERAPGV